MRRGCACPRAGAARGREGDGVPGLRARPPREEGGPAIPIREEALRILSRVDRGGAYADVLLWKSLEGNRFPDPRDRALLTELVMGTLRMRGVLDVFLSPHLSRPVSKTDALVRNGLRLGAYQLLYTRIPARVALFETVEAVKGFRGEKPAGLVNAVLRGMLREGRIPPPPGGEEAARGSVPHSLFEALARSLGEGETVAFLRATLEKPPFAVRANPFRVSREALLARLSAAGMDPTPCRYAREGLLLGRPGGIRDDPGFRSGEYLVMDEGAQLIAPLLSPREGESVLDACAAPGGKTTHLAALAGGSARITAVDLSEARARTLRDAVTRLDVPGVTIAVHDFSSGPLPGSAGRYDKVLVDAPCTGMGVIRRNPDAKWRFDPADPSRMASLQRAILRNAWDCLRPRGLLVYCTCSPLKEENEEVVDSFLRGRGDARRARVRDPGWPGPADAWTSEGFVRLSPHRHGTDGFFAALLEKGDVLLPRPGKGSGRSDPPCP